MMEPKKAIVIGATSGIGKAVAENLLKKGWIVGITGRRENLLNEIKCAYSKNCFTKTFDIGLTDQSHQNMNELINELNGLDLLVYSSGIGFENRELDFKKEQETIVTNTLGFTKTAGFLYDYFKQKGTGQMAVISSIAAYRGNPWYPSYAATKAYLMNYAESLSIKASLEKTNITITDLRTGFVKTGHVDESKMFWALEPYQAAELMVNAILKKKRVAYIPAKWWTIALVMKLMPGFLYKKLPF